MFTPRGPVAVSSQHTLWPRRRVSEAAILLSRAFAFVFSWYEVIIALSLCLSSGALQHEVHTSWKKMNRGSRITGPRIKDQGSVENESNKLNKLIGMIDCSSTWLSQHLPYAQAKIRENKRNRHKYNRYNKHKYTKYWKSHTTLKKCQFSPTDY